MSNDCQISVDAKLMAAAQRAVMALGRPLRLMEVCGTHTAAIHKFELRNLLPPEVTLVSGPGCPVCVTAGGYLTQAVDQCLMGKMVWSFGDMLRVPDTQGRTLRGCAGQVSMMYSPLQAAQQALAMPERQHLILAVGFETTAAPFLSAIKLIEASKARNIKFLLSLKRVMPVLQALATDVTNKIDGYILPGHVAAVTGSEYFRPLAEQSGIPGVVAGFARGQIVTALHTMLEMIADSEARIINLYEPVVTKEGNCRIQEEFATIFQVSDACFRGIGVIPGAGFSFNAPYRYLEEPLMEQNYQDPPGCSCGAVLRGIVMPWACPLFGQECRPHSPIGPCMVAQEGACGIAWQNRSFADE